MHHKSIALGTALALALLGWMNEPATAQDFPQKAITLVVPFAAGGNTDIVARIFAEELSHRLGEAVVVENRPGASGTVGASYVALSKPDGYTILLAPNSLTIAENLLSDISYDIEADLTPISMLTRYPYLIVGVSSLEPSNLRELIAYGKENPGTNFATTGVGTANHLIMEILNLQTGASLSHIPYQGGGDAIADLVSGRVPLLVVPFATVSEQLAAGQVKPIAVTTSERSSFLPDVQGFSDVPELSGFDVSGWSAVFAPASTPDEVIATYNKAISEVTADPDFIERMQKMNLEVTTTSPEQTKEFVGGEIQMWKQVIEKAEIQKQ